jgi:hypothetical protein
MVNAAEVDTKERMLTTRTEYSVLREVLKYDECGWSEACMIQFPRILYLLWSRI